MNEQFAQMKYVAQLIIVIEKMKYYSFDR